MIQNLHNELLDAAQIAFDKWFESHSDHQEQWRLKQAYWIAFRDAYILGYDDGVKDTDPDPAPEPSPAPPPAPKIPHVEKPPFSAPPAEECACDDCHRKRGLQRAYDNYSDALRGHPRITPSLSEKILEAVFSHLP